MVGKGLLPVHKNHAPADGLQPRVSVIRSWPQWNILDTPLWDRAVVCRRCTSHCVCLTGCLYLPSPASAADISWVMHSYVLHGWPVHCSVRLHWMIAAAAAASTHTHRERELDTSCIIHSLTVYGLVHICLSLRRSVRLILIQLYVHWTFTQTEVYTAINFIGKMQRCYQDQGVRDQDQDQVPRCTQCCCINQVRVRNC